MLQGKTIVITGANGALGRGAVAVATQHNARVIEFDIAFDADVENRYVVDLTKPETVRSCVAEVGTIDAVLNIAGGFAMGPPIYETSEDEWQHSMLVRCPRARAKPTWARTWRLKVP